MGGGPLSSATAVLRDGPLIAAAPRHRRCCALRRYDDVVKLLRDAGAAEGVAVVGDHSTHDVTSTVSDEAPVILFAASEGDLDELIKIRCGGTRVVLGWS